MLAKHTLLDWTEGSSWVKDQSCGPVSDISAVFSQHIGLLWVLKANSDSCAATAFAKSLPIGSEKDAADFKKHYFP